MLLNTIVQYCDEMYSSFGDECGCENGQCNHPSGECSGSCYNCLYHIHYPERAPEKAKTEYDCVKMLYHYVCQYSYLYTAELLCAFENEWGFIKDLPHYNILSLGCGGCADLMALELLLDRAHCTTPVSYKGIDVNALWEPIHAKIGEYSDRNEIRYHIHYADVFDFFAHYNVPDANIVVISYLISYLYNTNQIGLIHSLARRIANQVVKRKSMPLLLIINDVNSYKRGRDSFSYFEHAIRSSGLSIQKCEYKYFDTGNLADGQKLGSPYEMKIIPFSIPRDIQRQYHACTSINSTVQLLVEVS